MSVFASRTDLTWRSRFRAVSAATSVTTQLALAIVGGTILAYMIASGRWYVAVACMLAVPAYALIDRFPLAVVTTWLVVGPLVSITNSAATRKLYWMVHRGLPTFTLLLVVFGAASGLRSRRLPRLGPPELMMAGYVIVTYLSIAYTSATPRTSAYHLYDAVVVPMILYLLVRLVEPRESDLRAFVPAVAFVLVTQAAIGITSWISPGLLPVEWLDKVGQRTTGSLRSQDVFGAVVLFCGLFLLSGALNARGYARRMGPFLLFLFAILMAFLTFSRASWLAGVFVLVGVLFLARGFAVQLVLVLIPIVVLVSTFGLLNGQIAFARARLDSEQSDESALSRLPVAYASIQMFEAKPALGFGYENFNRFDFQYQRPVGNLVYPTKEHSSHNLYLTLLAEQGLVGFALYLGPAFWWLGRTKSRWRHLPRSGFLSRKLVGAMWLAVAAHVIVNNFSRMQVPFGLGIYWLSLGLIATVVSRQYESPEFSEPV